MRDDERTRDQLIAELNDLRGRLEALTQPKALLERAEGLAAENVDHFRLLYEKAPLPYQSLDERGNFIDVNEAWLGALGYTKEEVIGRNFSELLHPEWIDHFKENFPRFKAIGEVLGVEFEMLRKDGSFILVSFHGKIGRDQQGKFRQTHCIFQDITERRRAEENLKERDALHRSILRTAMDGFWRLDLQGRLLEVNETYCRMSGYTEQELLSMSVTDVESAKTLDGILARTPTIVSQGGDRFEGRHRRKDGSLFDVEVSIQFRPNEGGQFICFLRDISERKWAEEEMRAQKNLLDEIFRNSPYIMMLVNKDGRVENINRAGEAFAGRPREELLHLLGGEVFHCLNSLDGAGCGRNAACDSCPVRTRVARTLETGKPAYGEEGRLTILGKDSRQAVLDLMISTALLNEKEAVKVLVTIVDVTEAKRADERQRRLAEAVNQTSEGVVITDIQGIIEYANPAFERITGYSSGEVFGQTPRILKSGQHGNAFYKDLWDTIVSGQRWAGRVVNKRKDGSLYTAECSISPVKDGDGAIVNFVWVTRDISDELEVQKRVSQAQRLEAIGTLAGGIAHDFNNILASILGYTELALENAEAGTELEDDLQQIYNAGIRARDLVKQILAFSRKKEEALKPVRVSPIIKEALKLLRSTIPTSIELKHNIQSDSVVLADPGQIHQIIMNLCTNSFHALEESGGVLEVNLSNVSLSRVFTLSYPGMKPGEYVKLSVSDTGTGIPPEFLESIFVPYFTTKEPGEGTGLGLAVVHSIVKHYGGEITVESEVGKGTVFTVYLPITEKADEKESYKPEALQRGMERVLLVDDELPIATMGAQMLTRLGYQVTIQTDSLKALELFRSDPNAFDVVISDITMPHMFGDKLAVEMLKIRDDIPIILCTGYSKRISKEQIVQYGVKDLVSKPISRKDIAKTIRKVLDE